jgi:acetyltransferase-like isoleucine patch superfamily enzyme
MFSMLERFAAWRDKKHAQGQLRRAVCNVSALVVGPEVSRRFTFICPEKLTIGDHTVINGDCLINASGGVSFGRHCHIARGLTLYSSNQNWRSTTHVPFDDSFVAKPVVIGDGVWICANVSILPGITIGYGAILSMGAVVADDVPECAIVRGNPATVIGYRDKAVFDKLSMDGNWR